MKEIEALLDQCNVVQTTILFITSTYTMPKYNNEKSKYALTLLLYCNTSCCHAVDFLQTHPKWVGGQETPYQSLTFFSFAWYNHLKSFRRSIIIHTLHLRLNCAKNLCRICDDSIFPLCIHMWRGDTLANCWHQCVCIFDVHFFHLHFLCLLLPFVSSGIAGSDSQLTCL